MRTVRSLTSVLPAAVAATRCRGRDTPHLPNASHATNRPRSVSNPSRVSGVYVCVCLGVVVVAELGRGVAVEVGPAAPAARWPNWRVMEPRSWSSHSNRAHSASSRLPALVPLNRDVMGCKPHTAANTNRFSSRSFTSCVCCACSNFTCSSLLPADSLWHNTHHASQPQHKHQRWLGVCDPGNPSPTVPDGTRNKQPPRQQHKTNRTHAKSSGSFSQRSMDWNTRQRS